MSYFEKIGLTDISGNPINPATEPKQDILVDTVEDVESAVRDNIIAIGELATKLETQPVQISDAQGQNLVLDNNTLPVTLYDKTTPPFLYKAHLPIVATTLALATTQEDTTITVVSATSFSVGNYIKIFDTVLHRTYTGYILGIASNVITIDSPIDAIYPLGSIVEASTTDMAVNGSVTPQIFTIKGNDPGVDVTLHVTRILFTCITTAAPGLVQFGDRTALTNGLLIRTAKSSIRNIINLKTNIEMKGAMLDWDPLADTNPGVKIYGFVARLTFSGQEKLGTVLELAPGESLEFRVQDDLSSLVSFEIMVEGHEIT